MLKYRGNRTENKATRELPLAGAWVLDKFYYCQ